MRTSLAATAAAATLLAAAPLVGTASAAACPSWTDAAGDAAFVVVPDETVDITAVSVAAGDTTLVTTFTVPKLDTVNAYTPGDRFQLAMSLGGTAVRVIADRDDFDLAPRTGVAVGTSITSGGSVKYDVTAHKVVITMPYAVFDKALAKPSKGLAATSLVGSVVQIVSTGVASVTGNAFDTAAAPASATFTAGTVCGDGGTTPPVTPPTSPPVTPPPSGGPNPDVTKELPAAGCLTVSDPTGDAHPGNANVPNDPDLDITGLTLRTTGTALVGYLKVADLGTGPGTTDGHRFTLDFTFNGHVFSASGSAYKNGTGAIRDGLAQTGQAGKTTQLGVDVPAVTDPTAPKGFVDSGLKVTFDTKSDYVIFVLPMSDITKNGGKAFGGTISAVGARSSLDNYAVGSQADGTPTAPAVSYAVGTNKCFPSKLSLSVAKTAAARTVTAKLATTAGGAIAGAPVTFYLNGRKAATVTTGANGTAALAGVKPGTTVKAVFAGTSYGGSTATTKV